MFLRHKRLTQLFGANTWAFPRAVYDSAVLCSSCPVQISFRPLVGGAAGAASGEAAGVASPMLSSSALMIGAPFPGSISWEEATSESVDSVDDTAVVGDTAGLESSDVLQKDQSHSHLTFIQQKEECHLAAANCGLRLSPVKAAARSHACQCSASMPWQANL